MPQAVICQSCERLLAEASNALRRHASQMSTSLDLVRKGPTEEQVSNFRGWLLESFNEAQAAWAAYREHLIGHGLLSPSDKLQ